MEFTVVTVAVIAYVAFRQWLRHDRRAMIHRERLAAVEKGTVLPALEQEVERTNLNVQRILLLVGLLWISLGIGAFIALTAVISGGSNEVPRGMQWIGVAPVGIGLSHLIVYLVGKNKDR